MKLEIADIEAARGRIQSYIQNTQCGYSRSASELLGTEVFLKHENDQKTGSFKIRGAMNRLLTLEKDILANGVVACSAGNHAQGLAYSATALGSQAHIVMPESTPIVKVSATQGYGAKVILHGEMFDEAFQKAKELETSKGYFFAHPFHDTKVMAGQGTIGLELFEQVEKLDSVVVPIGGGGLISGIATALKTLNPKIKIFGVVPKNVPGMLRLYKGETLEGMTKKPTIADGLAVKAPNQEICDSFIKPLVDDIVEVSDDEIASSIVFLLERAKTVVEGSGAASLAAALKMKGKWDLGARTVMLLCGGNIDLNMISNIIERGLSKIGRLSRIQVLTSDNPGSLKAVTTIIAEQRANIVEVHHDRLGYGIEMGQTRIDLMLECKGDDHKREVIEKLKEHVRVIE
ncbi:MAG: threonine ammonia-lyase [Pseudomonadota bacterium]